MNPHAVGRLLRLERPFPFLKEPAPHPEIAAPTLRRLPREPEFTEPARAAQVMGYFLGEHRLPATRKAYRNDFQRFAAWLDAPSLEHAGELVLSPGGPDFAQRWIDSLVGAESYTTRARRASTLRTFFGLAHDMGLVEQKKLHLDVTRHGPEDLQGPSLSTLRHVLAIGSVRDQALVHLMATWALYPFELRAIAVEDYDGNSVVVRARSGHPTTLRLPEPTAKRLRQWVDEDQPKGALFHSAARTTRLTEGGFAHIFVKLSERCGTRIVGGSIHHFSYQAARELGYRQQAVADYCRAERPTHAASDGRDGEPFEIAEAVAETLG